MQIFNSGLFRCVLIIRIFAVRLKFRKINGTNHRSSCPILLLKYLVFNFNTQKRICCKGIGKCLFNDCF